MYLLNNLIGSLNRKEISLVRLILKQRSNSENALRLKLFELVLKGGKLNDSETQINIYGKKNVSAFAHLKKRLQNDVLNALLFQETSKKFRSRMFTVSVEVKKMMAFAEILYRRGLTEEGDSIIDEALKLCKEFELIGESYILMDFQRITQGITKGEKGIDISNEKISSQVDFIKSNAESVNIYYNFIARNSNKSIKDFKQIEKESHLIEKLETNYRNFAYSKNGFWFYRASLFYYTKLNDFNNALKSGNLLLELIENSPALYSPVTIAGTLKELSEIAISGKEYIIGGGYVDRALALFKPTLNNYLLTLENDFLINFYLLKFPQALEVIQKAKSHPRFKARKITFTRWNYFEACLEFAQGNFKRSNELIQADAKSLLADKGELQLGYRLLYILLLVETEKEELAFYELDSFRKSFKQIKEYKLDRIKIIQKVLTSLERDFWNFKTIIKKEGAKLQMLENDPSCSWQPFGFELINFEAWLKQKSEKY
jgi:hypothetical protein